jgi:hypothetical protein
MWPFTFMVVRRALGMTDPLEMTSLAIADAGLQPWTDDDLESMQQGFVTTTMMAFQAVVELQRQQVCPLLSVWAHIYVVRVWTCMQCALF